MLQRRQVDAEGRRPDSASTAAMMEAVGLRNDAKRRHPTDGAWDGEAPMSNAIMREDVRRDVKRAADSHPGQHGAAERDEPGRYEKRPDPEQVVPHDAPNRRMRMMRLMLAPERAMERKAMH